MSERTGWDRGLSATDDGKGLVGPAGAVLLRRLADRVGLTDALAGVLPSGTTSSWRDRATALVGLTVAIALGATNLLEAEQLQLHHGPLFGPAVSDSTLHRLLSTTDETRRAQIAKVRQRVPRHVWTLLHLRPRRTPRERRVRPARRTPGPAQPLPAPGSPRP
ncbi:hypothetical protein ABZZ74_43250 [Streptomyces sp. NPDC006476]|uniref:hypothetical protein n=1 Tax=Streptomyces sp. NPDC006476 TaxID=3157175 RepID=UPI0033BDB065